MGDNPKPADFCHAEPDWVTPRLCCWAKLDCCKRGKGQTCNLCCAGQIRAGA